MYNRDGMEYVRRSIRLADRDYSKAGCYFVTIRTHGEISFGEIDEGGIRLNEAGAMICREWEALSERFTTIILDEFIVMPDHFHGIVVLRNVVDLACEPRPIGQRQALPLHDEKDALAQEPRLSSIVQAFKSLTTRAYTTGVREGNWPPFEGRIWQRNYYERIIRTNKELLATREYIITNPIQYDVDHPSNDLA